MTKDNVKKIQIKESKLVDLIEKLVSEVVETKKVEWLAEQKVRRETVLESKIKRLEQQVNELVKK
jgi:hypothetical protein